MEQLLHNHFIMLNFTNKKLQDIIPILKENLSHLHANDTLAFEVLNPDIFASTYSGNTVTINEINYIHRGYKSWIDLAQQLHCRMLTPQIQTEHTILIRYELLKQDKSFHSSTTTKEEKYGVNSIFNEIHKNEESSFIYTYIQALQNVHVEKRVRILNLGVNSGDEFEVIEKLVQNFTQLELIGIDYCNSAITQAKEKFTNAENVKFIQHDINDLNSLNLGKFDLIITIGTLQSSNLEFNKLLMSIVQNQLKNDGAMILGFPNCRWIDGEMIYGARVKNYSFSEMGLLYKDVIFAKKYLQQKKFRVTLTGKDYIFLTATSLRKNN